MNTFSFFTIHDRCKTESISKGKAIFLYTLYQVSHIKLLKNPLFCGNAVDYSSRFCSSQECNRIDA